MPDGLRFAVSLLTIAPLRAGRIDDAAARSAIIAAPVVGALLGLVAGGAAVGVVAVGGPAAVGGVLAVALLAALTRGLHLDGLADTVDGLGSYGDAERSLAIMKKPDIGPFGVAAVVLALLAQAAAFAAFAVRPPLAALAGIVVAVAAGRAALAWACRRGVPAARPGGLGSVVAGRVPVAAAVVWTAALAAAAAVAVPDRPWLGPVAVLAGIGASVLLCRHTTRRLGGVTGDVFGACVEVTTTICAVTLTFAP
jgi:adenosylcobinamide-GDP ribazoletransferase